MDIVQVLVLLVVVGVILWMVNAYIPMAPPIKTIINVVVVLIVFGLLGGPIYLGPRR